MNKPKSRKTTILKYGLFAPLFLLAMVLSSAKISERKMVSTLSENAKPPKEFSKTLLTNFSSF